MTHVTAADSNIAHKDMAEAKCSEERDPLLALIGSGKDLWADEHADDYVRRLREG